MLIFMKAPVSRQHAELAIEPPRTQMGTPVPVAGKHFRRVLVEPDGSLRAWCTVARRYTRTHDLSEDEQATALSLACLVKVGRRQLVDGFVLRHAEENTCAE